MRQHQVSGAPPSRFPALSADPADGASHDKLSATREQSETLLRATRACDHASVRKPSYVLQREEREELAHEAHVLESLVEQLRARAGLPTKRDRDETKNGKARNVDLEKSLHTYDLYMGSVKSMVTSELLDPTVNPMSTFIHLPGNMAQRRAILRGLQEVKLRRGIDVATQRLHHLDHSMPYLCEERFTTASGEYHFYRTEINQFPNFRTVRQLYDMYVNFLNNMEISVTDMLGQFTLREDSDDVVDPTIWNHRFVTVADDVGCTEELNMVGFAQYYTHSPHTNTPMGVVIYDTVKIDDLYPYRPQERTSKDIQAVNMVCEVRKPGTNETVVVLKQCSFVVQLAPQFPLALGALKQLQDNMSRWPNAILKHLKEYVVPKDA